MRDPCKFHPGQLVRHTLLRYRGVVVDVDPNFQLSDEWYEEMANARPPKDAPWYHVLPHDVAHRTYVAECYLEASSDVRPVEHPEVDLVFERLNEDGFYIPRVRAN